MRRAAGEPGKFVGDFETAVVDLLGKARIPPEPERGDPLAAVWEVGSDLHMGGREREVRACLPAVAADVASQLVDEVAAEVRRERGEHAVAARGARAPRGGHGEDRKSTRLNSSHLVISYAVFCLKKKKKQKKTTC